MRSKLLASGGSFLRRILGDRCTGIPPLLSLCRWHYQHTAWMSTGECLLWGEKSKTHHAVFSSLCVFLRLSACFSLSPLFALSHSHSPPHHLVTMSKTENITNHVTQGQATHMLHHNKRCTVREIRSLSEPEAKQISLLSSPFVFPLKGERNFKAIIFIEDIRGIIT